MSVLVVEDNRELREQLVEELEETGPVLVAANGHDAIALIERTPALRAIVTDLDLGVGPDGLDVLRTGRAHHPASARVLVTARRDLRLDPLASELVEVVFGKPWVVGTISLYLRARFR